MILNKINRIHFVGIGGIGMSAIAEVLFHQGFKVSGSDRELNDVTERLLKLGIDISEGHSEENVNDVDALVYSSAVAMDNPEIKEALRRNIPVIKRAEMLAETMRMKFGIGVAGTHGKTTTTAMIGLTLIEAGLDPTMIVGGQLSYLNGSNARLGNGKLIVVEADEFDRT
ncbi:MAG: Mur ligase domain-containing protein, partial [Ignavibacteriaceae bacterium]